MDWFLSVFAAFGAECLDKLEGDYDFEKRTGTTKTLVSKKLPCSIHDAFENNKRCSFSFAIDTVTMLIAHYLFRPVTTHLDAVIGTHVSPTDTVRP
jgi:hypothetical protein